ncbi:hemerythrin superfamily protein [Streptomyces achromogenes]|uniref:Hemerythrin superfamily protein n=1 Tax=Streptomyces achromogenes TaxID=67255 RepID=A0ABU0QA17_STRAH|nr:hemerythrin domain-containing protein [Streptomyces achromogenes]MDQ0687211.1 hemerythrin superfamily protein [Streptomyces achromogenes]
MIQELTADHYRVRRLFDRIRSAEPGSATRGALVEQVGVELVRHAMVEREYLYPTVRDHVAEGSQWAAKELAEHAEIEEILQALQDSERDQKTFDQLVLQLVTRVTVHMCEEEQPLFPRLQAVCPADLLEQLGEKVRHGKTTTPTRPRPQLPDSPLLNKLAAPELGMIDRIRDVLTGRRRAR